MIYNFNPEKDPNHVRYFGSAQYVYLVGAAKIIVVVKGRLDGKGNSDGHYIVSAPGYQGEVFYQQRFAIERAREMACVNYSLDKLSGKLKEIISLHYFDGLNKKQVGERMGLTPSENQALFSEAFNAFLKAISEVRDSEEYKAKSPIKL